MQKNVVWPFRIYFVSSFLRSNRILAIRSLQPGHHDDRDPRHRTGHERPDNLDSPVGITWSAVNHVPGPNKIPRKWETNNLLPGRDDLRCVQMVGCIILGIEIQAWTFWCVLVLFWISLFGTKLSWVEGPPQLHFKPSTRLKSRRLNRKLWR